MSANETCDRCSGRATYRVTKGSRKLYFCSSHGRKSYRGLTAQGWTFWSLGHRAVAPQARP